MTPAQSPTMTARSTPRHRRHRLLHATLLTPLLLVWPPAAAAGERPLSGGELQIVGQEGQVVGLCPLKHTDVVADVAGFVSRVTVKQTFYNPDDEKIEAIYVFPLPQNAAVDSMVLIVGDRRVVGEIKERSEARRIYEQARAAGHVAGLLDEERPNIFTQSVANIEPGVEVQIEISYVNTLKYEDGFFEFSFPMVVGPRYIPGGGSAPGPMTTGQNTPQVPDGSRITPPVAPKGTRAGHDISLTVNLDAGMEIQQLTSVLHDVDVKSGGTGRATITLAKKDEIPNKDFILRYSLATEEIANAFLVHEDERGRFFTLILQPPKRVVPEQVTPRELIFVLDTSGSMRGFPIEKAKELMSRMIGTMRSADTFNLITFAGSTRILWDRPRPNTEQNRAEAQEFLLQQQGAGGTEMMKAINAALVQAEPRLLRTALLPSDLVNLPADGRRVTVKIGYELWSDPDWHTEGCVVEVNDKARFRIVPKMPKVEGSRGCPVGEPVFVSGNWSIVDGERVLQADAARRGMPPKPLRVVVFMTDGYVGNDMAIIEAVKDNADTTRVFSFGIGNGVNRFLLDGMAHAGRGEVEYVTLQGQAEEAVERFHERVLSPVLTDIRLDWGNMAVSEVYPQRIPDLFSSKPIMVHGRLDGSSSGSITVEGNTGAGPYQNKVQLDTPAEPKHDALASLWARAKVTDLMNRDLAALQSGQFPEDLKQQILDLGLKYHLLTPFTSFVAVEELTITEGGEPRTVRVPVEMPEGVSHAGVFGEARGRMSGKQISQLQALGYVGGSARGPTGGRGLVPAAAGGQPPPARPARVFNRQSRQWEADEEGDGLPDASSRKLLTPGEKLAPELRGLAETVEKEAPDDGNLTVNGVKIVSFRITVSVLLRDVSDETRKALSELGFQQQAESRTVRMLIGSIDVRKLVELAELDTVIRVQYCEAK